MTKKSAINRYKKNIQEAMEGKKRFSIVHCRQSCKCYVGIRFDDVILEYGQMRCVRNGHLFKMSIDLGNELEFMYYPLLRMHDELKRKWEREDALNSILD